MKFRIAFLIFLMIAVTDVAGADIRDARFRVDGDVGRIWLSFDEAPDAVHIERTPAGLRMDLGGVNVSSRLISPPDTQIVTALRLEPAERGGHVYLDSSQTWYGAGAEIYRGGVLVTIYLTGDIPTAAMPEELSPSEPAVSGHAAGPEDVLAAEPRFAAADLATGHGVEPEIPTIEHTAAVNTPSPLISEPVPDPTSNREPSDASAAESAHAVTPADPGLSPVADEPVIEATAEPVVSDEPEAPAIPDHCVVVAALVEADPWDDESLMEHAACRAEAGDTEEAIAIYQQMLAFEPENYTAAMSLADIRLAAGDEEGARELIDQAAMYARSDAEAARAMARQRELQGQ
jgi:hypothetical protein